MLKVALVFTAAALGFLLFQERLRAVETWAASALLQGFGGEGVHRVDPTTLLVVTGHHPAFHVLITPSCSSLASLLAFGCLGPLTPRHSLGRRSAAIGLAAGIVMSGNVFRIAGSVAVGLVAGRASLVLFHDWVGSMFTFVYTVGGYILMLTLLLPKQDRRSIPLNDQLMDSDARRSGERRRLWRRPWLRAAMTLGVLGALVAVASPAPASDDYPYADADPADVDPSGFLYRHCTSFVAWRLGQRGNFQAEMTGPNGVRGLWGHADHWAETARSTGFVVDATPVVGAVAHWHAGEDGAGDMGHVAMVRNVHPDGRVDVEEYNGSYRYDYGTSGPLRAPRYIHIYDIATDVTEPADVVPPNGQFTTPGADALLASGRRIDVSGEFSDASSVARVTFFVADGSYSWRAIGTDDHGGNGTYSITWTVDYPPGASLNFMAEAVDAAGNIGIDSVRGLEVIPVRAAALVGKP